MVSKVKEICESYVIFVLEDDPAGLSNHKRIELINKLCNKNGFRQVSCSNTSVVLRTFGLIQNLEEATRTGLRPGNASPSPTSDMENVA